MNFLIIIYIAQVLICNMLLIVGYYQTKKEYLTSLIPYYQLIKGIIYEIKELK